MGVVLVISESVAKSDVSSAVLKSSLAARRSGYERRFYDDHARKVNGSKLPTSLVVAFLDK